MTQASLSSSLVLMWLVSICVLFAGFISQTSWNNFVDVWTSVYLNYALCTLCLRLDMSMLAYYYLSMILYCPCYAWFLLMVGELPII
jgi:hypothetical protein